MSPPRLERLEALFGAALERPADERRAFLAEACGDDPALLAEVSALVAADAPADLYFERLASQVAASCENELEAAAGSGRRIGPYHTVELLGQGGMGAVYLARRVDGQFEQWVALKLVRRGMEGGETTRRFLDERRILASLDHRAIARLLDGGVTDDGEPWFAMEPVEGRPLTEHCDAGRLGLAARVRLFLEVASAVAYAHRNLVVHRDLKPGNVLATARGEVKLLDFGIAKLLGAEPGEATVARPLTPTYAAPEQLSGGAITVATDVYALGLLLYELLSGRRPHGDGPPTPATAARRLEGSEPPPPSALVGPGPAGDVEAATARGTSARALRRALRGDLDAVCLHALQRDPEARYPSVDALADDLRRWLDGRPVAAARPSWPERAVKLVRRHRLAAAAIAAIATLLVAFVVEATRHARRLERERDKAEQVAALFVDLFRVTDPGETRGETVTAREVLDRAAGRIAGELDGQPEVEAALLAAMGRAYRYLGLFDRAQAPLERALALRSEALGPEAAEARASRAELAELALDQGDLERAAAAFAALDDGEERLAATNGLGRVALARGDYAEAERRFETALALARERHGDDDPRFAEALNHLGATRLQKGDFAGAEAPLRDAYELRRRRHGGDHPSVAASLNNLASLYAGSGRLAEAEAALREVVASERRVLGDDHPLLATHLSNLGTVLLQRGELAAAEPFLVEALAIRRRRLAADHPDLAQTLANLGYLLHQQGRLEEAESRAAEALAIRRARFGEAHRLVGESLANLGLLARDRGDLGTARERLGRALEVLRGALGDAHPGVATALNNLATVAHREGDLAAAEALYRRALAIRRAALPPGHPHLAYALVGLGRVLVDAGRPAEARPLLEEGAAIRRATAAPDGRERAEAEAALAACRAALAEPAQAGDAVRSAPMSRSPER